MESFTVRDVMRSAAPNGERRDTKSAAMTRLAGTSDARMSAARNSSRASIRQSFERAPSAGVCSHLLVTINQLSQNRLANVHPP
jgi:hypothetical protein